MELVHVFGHPFPLALEKDGRLDLSPLKMDPASIIIHGIGGLVGSNGITKRTLEELRQALPRSSESGPLGTEQNRLQVERTAGLPRVAKAASDALQQFWLGLPTAKVNENDCLELPPGTYFMGDETYGSALFYRRHYPALWKLANSLKQGKKPIRGLIVRGTPGIGKSWWLFVVLWEAAKLGWTVVLQDSEAKSRLLFKGSTVLQGDPNAFQEELDMKDTLYLVDGEEPHAVAAWTIAVVSPLRAHYWRYAKKRNRDVRYMPVWSEKELLQARRLLYDDVDEQLVRDLYLKWGGSARYCLEWATDERKQMDLEQAVAETSLDACIKAVGNLDTATEASNRILHFDVSGDDYAKATVVFASRCAERLVMNTLMKHGRAKLQQEVVPRLGQRAYASFVGAAFEEIFHNMMETGCELLCRDLETADATPRPIRFRPCQTHMFLDEEDVRKINTANYFIPAGKTFEAVDSILKPDSVFQVTTAENHNVRGKGLETALQLLPERDVYKLFFAVPEHRFNSFKKQQITTAKGTQLKVPKGRVASVAQYVLRVVLV